MAHCCCIARLMPHSSIALCVTSPPHTKVRALCHCLRKVFIRSDTPYGWSLHVWRTSPKSLCRITMVTLPLWARCRSLRRPGRRIGGVGHTYFPPGSLYIGESAMVTREHLCSILAKSTVQAVVARYKTHHVVRTVKEKSRVSHWRQSRNILRTFENGSVTA